VLKFLTKHRPHRYGVREIARILRKAPSTVQEQLMALVDKGLVVVTKDGTYFVETAPPIQEMETVFVDGKAVKKGQKLTVNNLNQVFDPKVMLLVRHSQIPSYPPDRYRYEGVVHKPKELVGYALFVRI